MNCDKINVIIEVPSLRVDSGEIVDPYHSNGGGYTPGWGQQTDEQQYDSGYEPYGGDVRVAALTRKGGVDQIENSKENEMKTYENPKRRNDSSNNLQKYAYEIDSKVTITEKKTNFRLK